MIYICKMDYRKIIETLMEVYTINASDLAEKIDVQRSSISHILSGRNKPSLDFLLKIKEAFPELRWEFLFLGKLPMYGYEEGKINPHGIELPRKEENSFTSNFFVESEEKTISDEVPSSDIAPGNTIPVKKKNQTIRKIVWFYEDGTFESFDAM